MDYEDLSSVPEGTVVVLKQEVVEEVAMKQEEEGEVAMEYVADPTFDWDDVAVRDEPVELGEVVGAVHQNTNSDCDHPVVKQEAAAQSPLLAWEEDTAPCGSRLSVSTWWKVRSVHLVNSVLLIPFFLG